jgi:hypothetical protein
VSRRGVKAACLGDVPMLLALGAALSRDYSGQSAAAAAEAAGAAEDFVDAAGECVFHAAAVGVHVKG